VIPGVSSAVAVSRTVLLAAGLPFAFGSMAYKGVLFSTSAQPGWKDARWLGAYHVASAFALGAVVLLGLATVTGHATATHALRPAAAILVAAQVVPLALLFLELKPTLAGVYTPLRLRTAVWLVLGVGVAGPVPLLLMDGVAPCVLAALEALVGGWVVREVVVTLPHRTGRSPTH
jgi:hypothetical protein